MGDMERLELDNGLVVLAQEMHHAPVVAFSVWYRVGGRHEVPGITGISHWVEHMMFKGSAKYGQGALDREISARGGQYNGFTTEDFTAYYEVLPAEHLELAVDIEADRMGSALFDPADVESERTVIISEREGAENHPGFWLAEAADAACWTQHPYRQGVIGAKCDLQEITHEDLLRHYQAYYSPDNAVVVATGAFDHRHLFGLVEQHFGALPRGTGRRPLHAVEPPQTGPRRVEVRRPGPAHYFTSLYHIPPANHPDTPTLLCLAAVLGGGHSPVPWRSKPMGRSSRLYRALVKSGVAVRAGALLSLRADPGVLQIHATAAPPASIQAPSRPRPNRPPQGPPAEAPAGSAADPSAIEELIRTELDRLSRDGPLPAELASAKRQLEAQIAYSRAGMLGQAEWTGAFAMLEGEEIGRTLGERIASITPDDVAGAAQRYLGAHRATVAWFIPSATPAAGTDEGEEAGTDA